MTDDEKRAAMRALTDEDRLKAIDAHPNVVGHEAFLHRAKQVALRDAYRKPRPGGKA